MRRLLFHWIVALFLTFLEGCSGLAHLAGGGGGSSVGTMLGHSESMARPSADAEVISAGSTEAVRGAIIEPGQETVAGFVSASGDAALADKRVELSFVDTDLREFARVFFSELLHVPYLIDPNIGGTVTVRSGGKIDGVRALALAKQALEAAGSTIRLSDGVYRVTGLGGAGYEAANLKTFTLTLPTGGTLDIEYLPSTYWTNGYNHDRLLSATNTNTPALSQDFAYDLGGKLTSNSQVCAYTYPVQGSTAFQPHAVTTAGA